MPRDIDFAGLRSLRERHGVDFPPGHVIFEAGEPGDNFYVILEGEVEMFARDADEEIVLAVLGRGDFFGEMAVFRDVPRSAAARTREHTRLLYFSASTAAQLLATSPRFALGIIRTLCDRIDEHSHELIALRHEVDALRAGFGVSASPETARSGEADAVSPSASADSLESSAAPPAGASSPG